MWDVGRGAHREGHTHTKEEHVPVGNPTDATLFNELNGKTPENGAIRRKENTKYKIKYIMNILECSGRKPALS